MSSIQEKFLKSTTKNWVKVFLLSGVKLEGNLIESDDECLTLSSSKNNTQLIYKHAVATVLPSVKAINGNY